jgi:membrane-associated protease RseP (regulator of RpoE activity)
MMTEIPDSNERITDLVERHFEISQVTWGGPKLPFVVRYEGVLTGDALAAHETLFADLQAENLTPLFLEDDDGQQIVQIIEGLPKAKRSNPWINLILFLLTLLSMLFTGAQYVYGGNEGATEGGIMQFFVENPWAGLPFAASLLAILLAHEFGHYIAGRIHRTDVTLPYFLPFPFSPFGTLGAFIQLKSPPRNKRELLDIGLAGPIAGLVVAIPILLLGLSLSELDRIPLFIRLGDAFYLEGNSIIYLFSKYVVFHEWIPTPMSYGDLSPALYWARYLLTGLPTPLGGMDVMLHPVAWAGWAGLLVTSLNLIPAGQLDGGHLLYSLLGRDAKRFVPAILIVLAALGFYWSGWWLWVFLIFMMGRSHAQPLNQITRLDPTRKFLAILGLVIFVLVFTPIPLRPIIGPFFGP